MPTPYNPLLYPRIVVFCLQFLQKAEFYTRWWIFALDLLISLGALILCRTNNSACFTWPHSYSFLKRQPAGPDICLHLSPGTAMKGYPVLGSSPCQHLSLPAEIKTPKVSVSSLSCEISSCNCDIKTLVQLIMQERSWRSFKTQKMCLLLKSSIWYSLIFRCVKQLCVLTPLPFHWVMGTTCSNYSMAESQAQMVYNEMCMDSSSLSKYCHWHDESIWLSGLEFYTRSLAIEYYV